MDAVLSTKESTKDFYDKLFSAPDAATFDALFAEAYSPAVKVKVSGKEWTFDSLKAHFAELRAGPPMSTTVHELLRDGRAFAWRQTSEADLPDGKRLKAQIFMFGSIGEDDKIVEVNELVRFD